MNFNFGDLVYCEPTDELLIVLELNSYQNEWDCVGCLRDDRYQYELEFYPKNELILIEKKAFK